MTDQESMEEDVLGMLKTRKLKTTSNEDRERIVQAREMGSSVSVIAKSLNIKRTTVYNVLRKYHATMKVEAEPRGKTMPSAASNMFRNVPASVVISVVLSRSLRMPVTST
uniref:Uncharacterized protein n=1 Tax=Anopheles coluzzii TaxID=1518534 RepID=A0A8W7PRN9_ANOCL